MTNQKYRNAFDESVMTWTTKGDVDFSVEGRIDHFSQEQKTYLKHYLDNQYQTPIVVQQVHGDQVVCVDNDFLAAQAIVSADALVTSLPKVPIAVRTADCLPVFLHDPTVPCVAVIHAGWKGSLKQIVIRTIEALTEHYHSNPVSLKVALGPAIGLCCYEVGNEFNEYFSKDIVVRDERFYLDLKAVNRKQLLAAGVSEQNIFNCDVCTCCDKDYHSYRREGKKGGRMLSGIVIKED